MYQAEQGKDSQVSRRTEGIATKTVRVIAGLNVRMTVRVIAIMTVQNLTQKSDSRKTGKTKRKRI